MSLFIEAKREMLGFFLFSVVSKTKRSRRTDNKDLFYLDYNETEQFARVLVVGKNFHAFSSIKA